MINARRDRPQHRDVQPHGDDWGSTAFHWKPLLNEERARTNPESTKKSQTDSEPLNHNERSGV